MTDRAGTSGPQPAAGSLDPSQLAAVPAFADLGLTELRTVLASAESRELRRGDVLVRKGEPSDALYFVVSGRFAVENEAADMIAEIGQGQPIGEIGFFADVPRTATVRALRDSHVLAITRERLRRIGDSIPQLRNAVIGSLANRLARAAQVERRPARPRTIAVVLAGASRPAPRFLDLLRRVFGARSRACFLARRSIEDRFGGLSLDDPAISAWLNALEVDFDFVFYLADEELTDWTQKCARQADLLLLVAAAGAESRLNPCERLACSLHPPSARRLVVLHDARSDVAAGTGGWLGERDVFMHHHAALQDAADIERLFRFLSGRAIGFVAGGGGSLGSAHIGVYKALREFGADFDIFGGTSVGAAVTAALARGLAPEQVDEATHNIFVKRRSFRRYSLPRYGLLNHKIFDRALRAEYGDVVIEDLWKPFFAVSANLSHNRIMLHRRGPVWEAVRASASIPALLPPFFTAEGEMLVDGGIVDNVPLAPMKALKSGPNVVVRLRPPAPARFAVDYASIPGPSELLLASLNPFRRQERLPVPSILQVIILSMVANRRQDLTLESADMLIEPKLPPDLQWTRWERHSEVFMGAYHAAAATLRQAMAEADPRLVSILGRE